MRATREGKATLTVVKKLRKETDTSSLESPKASTLGSVCKTAKNGLKAVLPVAALARMLRKANRRALPATGSRGGQFPSTKSSDE